MITKTDKLITDAADLLAEDRKQFQRNQVEAQKQRDAETLGLDHGRDRTHIEAQIGRPLQRAEFVKRIQSLVPDIYYEQSKALSSRGGLYLKGMFLTGMEHGISPEFSVMEEVDGHGRVLMKGWRSILAQLIAKRYITVEDAENTFGILRGAQSERWWSLVKC